MDGRLQHGSSGGGGRAADGPAADGRSLFGPCQGLPQRRQWHGPDAAPRQADRRSQRRPRADAALPHPPRTSQRRRPEPCDGRPARGRKRAGWYLRRSLGRLEPGRRPGLWEDGDRRTRGTRGTVVVHVLHRQRQSPDRDRRDRRGRRLRRGNRSADRTPDRLAVVRQAEEVRCRELEDVLSPLSPIKPTEEAPAAPARTLRLPLDPLLTLAVLGLGVCSGITLRVATRPAIPGAPPY